MDSMTSKQRMHFRQQVSAWVRTAIHASPFSRRDIELQLNKDSQWLANRLARAPRVGFWKHELRDIADVLRVMVPPEVEQAADRSHEQGFSQDQARRMKLDTEALASADSAGSEMLLLLRSACTARPNSARDLDWMVRRFGLAGRPAQTLDEIGVEAGMTRERVRQVEERILELVSILAANQKLRCLSTIHVQVLESAGLPWGSVEHELQSGLGQVSLHNAIRFFEAIQSPDQIVEVERASIYGAGNSLKVIAKHPKEARLLTQVSSAARKLVSFAGAATVNDIHALVEHVRKEVLSRSSLLAMLNALPSVQWFDDTRRWCWFDSPDLSSLLRRVATILKIAAAPVDMETLYAGLVREARRDTGSQAAAYCDAVPPSHVVHAILLRHPDFRRTSGNAFTYEKPFDLYLELEPTQRLVVECFEQHGGVATRDDLYALTRDPNCAIPRNSFAAYLYLWGFVERIDHGIWALRGRPIEEADRQAAQQRAISKGKRPGHRPTRFRHDGQSSWEATVTITLATRANRNIYFKISEMPKDVAGTYRLSDGHQVNLIQDAHGDRLTNIGAAIKEQLSDLHVQALRFRFDANSRSVTFSSLVGSEEQGRI